MDGWDEQIYLNWTNFTIQGPVIAAITAEESAELVRCPREAPAVTRWWRSCRSRQRWPLSFMLCLICTSSIPSFFIQFTALLLSHQRYRSSRGVIECGDGNLVGRCVCLGDQGRTLGRWDQVVMVAIIWKDYLFRAVGNACMCSEGGIARAVCCGEAGGTDHDFVLVQ